MDELFTPEDDRKISSGLLKFFAIFSTIIGIGILVFYIHEVSKSHSMPQNGEILNLTNFGAFGDFIAGAVGTFFSLAGFFMLFLTLKDQRDNFHRERLESNFFEMIKIHRDNVSEMQFSYYENKESKVIVEKRKVFRIIFKQFKDAWNELDHIFEKSDISDIYENLYLNKIQSNKVIAEREIDLKEFAKVDIIYSIIFFGLSGEDKQTIINLFENKYKRNFMNTVLNFASLKPRRDSSRWIQWKIISELVEKEIIFDNILKKRTGENNGLNTHFFIQKDDKSIPFESFYPDDYYKYYGGHQFRLGHYFRHIYQTVKFIDKEGHLSFDEKYSYIKILRGQLSNYEQIIFFLNSLSEVGRTWELLKESQPEKETTKNQHLITNYNLIKNIPNQYIADSINLLNYYPNIEYEVIHPT
jgi:hypothetical protein